jgi:hypothetical protein
LTILAAACALVDDLVDSGSFSAAQVSACDYGILTTMAATCGLVIQPGTTTIEEHGFGSQEHFWGIEVEAYLKDTGDPTVVLANTWHIHDAVIAIVSSGSTLNTPTRKALVTGAVKERDLIASFGGNDFIPVSFTVQVREDC